MATYPRERNPYWKGGKTRASNGYILIKVEPNHHLADCRGYAYEHRLVAEQKLGRRLEKGELVHHKDENKANNNPNNLEVVSSTAHHRRMHSKNPEQLRGVGAENPIIHCACGCGATLLKYDSENRSRKFISGHNKRCTNGR